MKSQMSFGEAIKVCFSKYATFTGRARRSEYWFFYLFQYLIGNSMLILMRLILLFCLHFMSTESSSDVSLIVGIALAMSSLCVIAGLVLLIPSISVMVRRLHDIGKSGWNCLLLLIPIVGFVLLTVWACTDSQPGANKWGANPKEDDGEPESASAKVE